MKMLPSAVTVTVTTYARHTIRFITDNPPIPIRFLRKMLGLILNKTSFQFNGTSMGTKMAVSFANIFMAKIETTLKHQRETKPKEWRRCIDDIFLLPLGQ